MGEEDIPSPIDFHDPAQARAWETDTVARRPYRPEFFAAFASELKNNLVDPFLLLELGSGPGHLARAILSECPGATYYALDFSEAMHSLARERLDTLSRRVQFVTRNFCQPDWCDGLGPFDAVVTMQ